MQPSIRAIASLATLATVAFSAVSLAATDAPAAGAPGAGTAAPISSPAMDQMRRLAGFLAQLPRLSVSIRSGYDVVQASGQKIELGERRELVLVRPDHLRVDVEESDGEASSIAFDGQTIGVYNATLNMYAASPIRGDVDAAIMHFVKDLEMRLPLALMFTTGLPKELAERVEQADIVETALLDGKPFVHLAARADDVDFQVWIPQEGDPLPRRIVITYKHEPGQPQYWADFSNWNLAPDPPASLFTLTIPADAERIEFLAEIPKAGPSPATSGAAQ